MTEVLGYRTFISAGGDHGAIITQSLARRRPELLIGVHLTDVGYPGQATDYSTLSPAEMEMAQWLQRWWMEEGIYDPPLPRAWAARHVNLVRFTEFPRGGHFMAWEEPELYAQDVQEFVRQLRASAPA